MSRCVSVSLLLVYFAAPRLHNSAPLEYIKRYEGLHTGKDDFRSASTGNLIKVGEAKELFSGIQFLRKFPKHVKRISEEKGRAITLLDYGCGKGNMPWRPFESYTNGLWGHLPTQIQSIYLYDPCWPPFAAKPPQGWQFDVVGCADVMEHIPEEDVDTVLADIASFCKEDGQRTNSTKVSEPR